MTNFNDVKIGGRFCYKGEEYIKTCSPQNGEVGAVHICTGTHRTDCTDWIVEFPIKPTKEREKDNQIAVFTFMFWEDKPPVIMQITEEQKRVIEILHNYDILTDDISVNFKGDTFIVNATKE